MRLIDADALLCLYNESAIVELGEYGDGCLDIISDIERAPTIDAVPVVRCKDCKNYTHIIGRGEREIWGCSFMGRNMSVNDFCSHGERRENNE